MRKIKIGETVTLKCVEDKNGESGCDRCFLAQYGCDTTYICKSTLREDGKNVHFEEVPAIGKEDALKAFHKAVGWCATYPWFEGVENEFTKALED